jgi:hypothetical protein
MILHSFGILQGYLGCGYDPILLWNCTVCSRFAAFTSVDILVYQLIVTHVYCHCLFHYKMYVPVFVVYQPRCVTCHY